MNGVEALALVAPVPTPTPIEKILGPWLDLRGGGVAVGPASSIQQKNPDGTVTEISGSLSNGSLLPADGNSFHRFGDISISWGTGLMISLIENASAYYAKNFVPGNVVYVNAIAQEHGGPYGPHKSHENGLDADIFYMGQTKWESVLDANGQVTSKFDPQKNWDFWRLLAQQKILVKGKPLTAVYMIFVAPQIKDFLCTWTANKNMVSDPLNADILRRLRPTVGHDTHFHLRLRCSPYYKDCIQQNEPAEGTGCENPAKMRQILD